MQGAFLFLNGLRMSGWGGHMTRLTVVCAPCNRSVGSHSMMHTQQKASRCNTHCLSVFLFSHLLRAPLRMAEPLEIQRPPWGTPDGQLSDNR